jgi:hypothetical protein
VVHFSHPTWKNISTPQMVNGFTNLFIGHIWIETKLGAQLLPCGCVSSSVLAPGKSGKVETKSKLDEGGTLS